MKEGYLEVVMEFLGFIFMGRWSKKMEATAFFRACDLGFGS